MTKRALFLTHSSELGGAELFLIDLIRRRPEHWFGAFFSDGAAPEALRGINSKPIILHARRSIFGVSRRGSVLKKLLASTEVIRLGWKLSLLAKNFDVICANSQKALFVGAVASLLSRKPLIWILHDILDHNVFSASNVFAMTTVARLCARLVVANSIETAHSFIRHRGSAMGVQVIYNGFEVDGRQRPSAELGAKLKDQLGFDARPIVGLFGRIAPWKGQHILLEALAQNPSVQAIIVGGPLFGEEDYDAQVRALTTELALDARVRFLGFRDDVPALMAAVDLVVHTSTEPEPFGRVIVEGQLAGRPVIATAGGGAREIIQSGINGILVPPGDANALTVAINEMISDPGTARRIANAGYESAVHRFGIDQTLRDLEHALEVASN